MAQSIREVMTENPLVCPADTTVADAARQMKDRDIGDVLVEKPAGGLCGVVTDRDIVTRAVAEGRDPASTRLDDVCNHELFTLTPDSTVEDAVRLMREHAVRRVPVVEADRAVGIVSIGDLAVERDTNSVLADISAAPGDR